MTFETCASYFGLGSVHKRQTVLAFMVKAPSCCAGLIGETALFLVSTAWRRRIFLKRNPRILFGGREKAKLMIQILIRPSYFGLGSVHTRQTVLAFMVKTPSCCAGLIGETALNLVSTPWRRRIFLKLRNFGSYRVRVAP